MSNCNVSDNESGVIYTFPYIPDTKYRKPGAKDKFDHSKAIPVKFMRDSDGNCIVDRVSEGSNSNGLYTRLNADGTIDESSKFINPNNFLVVPVVRNVDAAQAYAAKLNAKWLITRLGSMIGHDRCFSARRKSGLSART